MSRTSATAFLLAFATALPARAATWHVPGTSASPGRNGTFFVTELKIRNTGTSAASVGFDLLPLSGATPAAATRSVPPGETLVLPNALVDLFGAGQRAGTVRVTSSEPLFINARTYNNADPAGTFGLAVESVDEAHLLTPGQVGHIGWIAQGADGSKGFRTNVGIVLAAAGSSVDAVVFGANGTELGRKTFAGGPLATQVSVADIASGDLAVARLELRVTAGKATGYSAVVDNVTGDGFTVAPSVITPGNWADVTLNGIARGPGRFGTFFRTDVRIVNPTATSRKVTISGLSLAAGGQPVPASATVEVGPHGVKELLDVLGDPLAAPEGVSGSLRFTSDAPVLVLGRTSNVRADGATFGSIQRTIEGYDYLNPLTTGSFVGLIQSGATPGFRTNVGFLAGLAGAVVDLTLKDKAGATLSSRPAALTLPAQGFTQPTLQDLFPGVTIPENVTLEVRPSSGTVDVYASFIDNGTGDPVIYPFLYRPAPVPDNVSVNSPCPANPGAAGLVNAGTKLFRVDLDLAKHPDAVCNDGTGGAFYARKGTGTGANRWVIFLEGGGGCSSGSDCQDRWCSANTNFGAFKMSNRYLPAKGIGGGGILSDRADNVFANFNTVWIAYCSSDSWAGRARDRILTDDTRGRTYSLHFLGARILDAVLTELRAGVAYQNANDQTVTMPSLDDAEVVLFTGESAGGRGSKTNADRVGAYLQGTNRTGHLVFRGVFDASDQPSGEGLPEYEQRQKGANALEAVLKAARLDESCLARHPNDPWRCSDVDHLTEHHVTTPFFVRTDLLDSNTTKDFGTEDWIFGDQLWLYAQLTWDHLDRLTRIRQTAEEKADIAIDPGVYGPHCDNHTALRDDAKFYGDKVATASGPVSFHDALRNWLLSQTPGVAINQPRPTADPVPRSAVCTSE
jgi:hypothetical protein